MASLDKRLPANANGTYYVDSSCINCDTCREVSPSVFAEHSGYSIVLKQPETPVEIAQTHQAIIACPTGSIGSTSKLDRRSIMQEFPLKISEEVFYCGFNSPNSYGAKSYFIQHPTGNWLIDSPRFSRTLVQKIEELGGLKFIFLTHQDDVADADKFAEYFAATRIIHYFDKHAQPQSERIIKGKDPIRVGEDFLLIPTPGHTQGHMVLLYRNTYLFTGDHLYKRGEGLRATRRMCWWNWPEQVRSMQRLLDYDFEWILPGHGHRLFLAKAEMRKTFTAFVKEMSRDTYW